MVLAASGTAWVGLFTVKEKRDLLSRSCIYISEFFHQSLRYNSINVTYSISVSLS